MDSVLLLVTSVANTLTTFCGFSIHSPVIICCGRLKNAFDIIHINPFLHDSFCVCVLLYSWRMYYSFIIFIHLNFQQNKSLILLLKKCQRVMIKSQNTWNETSWTQSPPLPLTNCGNLAHLTSLILSFYTNKIAIRIIPSLDIIVRIEGEMIRIKLIADYLAFKLYMPNSKDQLFFQLP